MSVAVLALSKSLEIRDVEEARGLLLTALDGISELRVDLSAVDAADTAGVQLLLSLEAEAAHRGIRIVFVGQSAGLTRALQSLGLQNHFVAAVRHGE
jgi:anti-anti-sigma factor